MRWKLVTTMWKAILNHVVASFLLLHAQKNVNQVCKCKCKYHNYYPPPSGLFRDNLQHWLGNLSRLLKVQFTKLVMKEWVIMHECESEIDHYTGHYVPYSLQRVCGFFNVPQIYYMCKGLWDRAYSLSSSSEKTRKSNSTNYMLGGPCPSSYPLPFYVPLVPLSWYTFHW